jgi:hypothetical protein
LHHLSSDNDCTKRESIQLGGKDDGMTMREPIF